MDERQRAAVLENRIENLCERFDEMKTTLTEHMVSDIRIANEVNNSLSEIKLSLAERKSASDVWFKVVGGVVGFLLIVLQAVVVAHVVKQ